MKLVMVILYEFDAPMTLENNMKSYSHNTDKAFNKNWEIHEQNIFI